VKYRQERIRLKKREIKFSKNLQNKRNKEDNNKSILKILETIYTLRRRKKKQEMPREEKLKD